MDLAAQVLDDIDVPFSWIGKLTPPEAGIRLRTDDGYVDLPQFAVDEVARYMTGPRDA
jgi:hypothetical protein